MKDEVITFAVIGAFALLVTLHVAISFGLARQRHFAESLGALIAVPLAPWLAWRRGMTARSATWVASAIVYIGALIAAR